MTDATLSLLVPFMSLRLLKEVGTGPRAQGVQAPTKCLASRIIIALDIIIDVWCHIQYWTARLWQPRSLTIHSILVDVA